MGQLHVIGSDGSAEVIDYSKWSVKTRIVLAQTLLASATTAGKWLTKNGQGNVIQALVFVQGDGAADVDRATSGIKL